ncbi:MAG TPA: type II toxin-antitoxin system prevent-host-death family antitoxin [Gemmataceae bacterium]|nr:type II toxin-antitoxin system prevent-host-death family antitoxin [Gemmataceae bacterium]
MEWQLADAKTRFSEVINRALKEGPQWVRRRKDEVVVVSREEYNRLAGRSLDFKQYLMQGESFEGLDLSRDNSPGRDIAL